MPEFSAIVEAWKRRDQAQWQIGDEIIAAAGPPGSRGQSNDTLARIKTALESSGYECAIATLNDYRAVAYAFQNRDRSRFSWTIHRIAGDPAMLNRIVEAAGSEPLTTARARQLKQQIEQRQTRQAAAAQASQTGETVQAARQPQTEPAGEPEADDDTDDTEDDDADDTEDDDTEDAADDVEAKEAAVVLLRFLGDDKCRALFDALGDPYDDWHNHWSHVGRELQSLMANDDAVDHIGDHAVSEATEPDINLPILLQRTVAAVDAWSAACADANADDEATSALYRKADGCADVAAGLIKRDFWGAISWFASSLIEAQAQPALDDGYDDVVEFLIMHLDIYEGYLKRQHRAELRKIITVTRQPKAAKAAEASPPVSQPEADPLTPAVLSARAQSLLNMADQGKITITAPERNALTRIARAAAAIDHKFLATFDDRLRAPAPPRPVLIRRPVPDDADV